jgi:hypothetical protein
VAVAALLLIGSACTSSFAKDNAALCGADKIQRVKEYVANDGLTPQAAADKAGTDARCLTTDETTQAQATYAAFKAAATPAPTAVALSTTAPTASPTESPSPTAAPTDAAPTEQPGAAPTQAPATPKPATPKPAPTATPVPTPTPAPGDAGWPPKSVGPIQSNEAPITGRVTHANGTGAGHYCLILTSGPCAATTNADGTFTLKFASGFGAVTINLVVKGQYNSATGDGPVVATKAITMTATGISNIFITVP